MNLVFFGSFQHFSTIILKSLHETKGISVQAVVTTPPHPKGRQKTLTNNPTHQYAISQNLPVYTPTKLNTSTLEKLISLVRHSEQDSHPTTHANQKKPGQTGSRPTGAPDFFLVAGYGNILPKSWLEYPQHGALNLHFSLLPKYRGANPAEWAILLGEKTTGITLIEMTSKVDAGNTIAKSPANIDPQETRITLYQKLYQLGAHTLPTMLKNYHLWTQHPTPPTPTRPGRVPKNSTPPMPQSPVSPSPQAKQFKRPDAFIDWRILQQAIQGNRLNSKLFKSKLRTAYDFLDLNNQTTIKQILFIERSVRSLATFPGIWTIVQTPKGPKRLKLHSIHIEKNALVFDEIQLEGQKKSTYNQIKNSILLS